MNCHNAAAQTERDLARPVDTDGLGGYLVDRPRLVLALLDLMEKVAAEEKGAPHAS